MLDFYGDQVVRMAIKRRFAQMRSFRFSGKLFLPSGLLKQTAAMTENTQAMVNAVLRQTQRALKMGLQEWDAAHDAVLDAARCLDSVVNLAEQIQVR